MNNEKGAGTHGPGWPTRVAEYLLIQHSTPCPLTNRSPAELLMGRRLRTVLDRLHPGYAPSKPLASSSAHQPLCEGALVYARNYASQPLWLPRKVIAVTGPCSYKIDMGQGRVWRRHQDKIRLRWALGKAIQGAEGETEETGAPRQTSPNRTHAREQPNAPRAETQNCPSPTQPSSDRTTQETPERPPTTKPENNGNETYSLAHDASPKLTPTVVEEARNQQPPPAGPRRSS